MEFRILGPLGVERDGRLLSLGSGRFDWLDAAFGALAAVAVVAGAALAALLVLERKPRPA